MKRGKNFSPFHSFKYFVTHFLCAQQFSPVCARSPCSFGDIVRGGRFLSLPFFMTAVFLAY